MSAYSSLFRDQKLLSRVYFDLPTLNIGAPASIIVPSGATVMRASGVGAGGMRTGSHGGSAAYARMKGAVTAGETLTVQTGNSGGNLDANVWALGDTVVKRVTGNVTLLKAARGQGFAAGSSADCIGDVKRSGQYVLNQLNGLPAAGDDEDDYGVGIGNGHGWQNQVITPSRGGSGAYNVQIFKNFEATYIIYQSFYPGHGHACLEFFKSDPGYS